MVEVILVVMTQVMDTVQTRQDQLQLLLIQECRVLLTVPEDKQEVERLDSINPMAVTKQLLIL